jgi:hypothetical protein
VPLNIVKPDLEKVKPELHGFYVKDAKSGKYHLELSDLKSYVEARVSPIENELKLTRENERKLSHSIVLRNANVLPEGDELLVERLERRIAIDTVDGRRVISILAEDGKSLAGKGSNGLATIDDLVKEATTKFPSIFNGGGMPPADIEDTSRVATKKSITRKSDFMTEKDRAAFVNAMAACVRSLPDCRKVPEP